jgi:hypothetical protein
VLQRVLTRYVLRDTELKTGEGYGGAVTLIQRFGSAVNLNIHLHCLLLDGVYRCGADDVRAFVEVSAPNDEALHALLQKLIIRLKKLLSRRGVLVQEEGRPTRPTSTRTRTKPAPSGSCRRRPSPI